ncbi:MAG: hypothetical protein M5R37_14555 [Melioribacteraceae bacterium]|jgi:hypothetical protein|nr:hypothetical protein [Melioribacteraceae bacterium]
MWISRIVAVLILILLFTQFGCEDNVVNNDFNYVELNLEGKVLNKYDNTVDTLFAIIHNYSTTPRTEYKLSSSLVKIDSTFEISLSTPPEEYLTNYYSSISGEHIDNTNLHIEDESTKGCEAYLNVIERGDGVTSYYFLVNGNTQYCNTPVNPGDFCNTFYFFNESTSIQGYSIIEATSSLTYRMNYNLNIKAGWNIISTTFISRERGLLTFEVTAVENPNGNWFY